MSDDSTRDNMTFGCILASCKTAPKYDQYTVAVTTMYKGASFCSWYFLTNLLLSSRQWRYSAKILRNEKAQWQARCPDPPVGLKTRDYRLTRCRGAQWPRPRRRRPPVRPHRVVSPSPSLVGGSRRTRARTATSAYVCDGFASNVCRRLVFNINTAMGVKKSFLRTKNQNLFTRRFGTIWPSVKID